jgi:hypothetical protein
MRRHLTPVTGTVGISGPNSQPMGDAFIRKRTAQRAVVVVKRVLFADGERDVHAAHWIDQVRVVQIREKMIRSNEVNVLVVVSVEQI